MAAPFAIADAPRAALIGGGFIGPVHAEALRRIGVPVVGLLGSSPDRARPLAERLGIPRVYRDLDELLADTEIGTVHVASPNAVHFVQTRRVLESGRHIVCEKPLAITASQTASLLRLAEARPGQAAAVNYNIRFYPLCLELKARIARGDLGGIISVTGSYAQDWLLRATDHNWRVEPDGGTNLRVIADIGTHWMDLAQFVTGLNITSVNADLATFHPTRSHPIGPIETFGGPRSNQSVEESRIQTEDYGAVLLHLEGGARGVFHVMQMNAGRKNRLTIEVAGTEGSAAWDSERPNGLWLGHRDAPNQWLERDPTLLAPTAAAACHYPGGHAEGFADTFKQLALAFHGWIAAGRAGEPPFPTFADGHRELCLCEAIAQSQRERRWVELDISKSLT